LINFRYQERFEMMRTYSALAISLIALSAVVAGCSSSTLVNMWKDPVHPQQPIDKAYVIGVKRDATARRLIEDTFVGELTRFGLTAVPSYREFASALPDTQQVRDVVDRDGYDGVVVVVPLGTETRETYVPGYVTTVPGPYYGPHGYGYGYWGSYYYPAYQTIYQPGYVERSDIVRIRVDVWSIDQDGMRVWTGTTETLNPSSVDQLKREVLQLVIPELRRKGVIAMK
jgi:hypothetical protein